jgi:hypothetical protein
MHTMELEQPSPSHSNPLRETEKEYMAVTMTGSVAPAGK